jgi:predicted nucleotidyltransferase
MDDLDTRILPALESVTQELMDAGVQAVALTGSWARKDAHAESDLDILVLGEGSPYRLEQRDGLLLSVSSLSFEHASETMRRPESACFVVPGWRDAKILYDPEGLANHLHQEAQAWTWEVLEEQRLPWVTEEITDFAEEVHKLAGLLERDQLMGAAAQRAVLSLRLAPVMAVHEKLLYRTENELWQTVAEALGPEWTAAQEKALGLTPVDLQAGCLAALELYALAAKRIRDTLDERQTPVIKYACEIIRRLAA